jgi:hypothetical protein
MNVTRDPTLTVNSGGFTVVDVIVITAGGGAGAGGAGGGGVPGDGAAGIES